MSWKRALLMFDEDKTVYLIFLPPCRLVWVFLCSLHLCLHFNCHVFRHISVLLLDPTIDMWTSGRNVQLRWGGLISEQGRGVDWLIFNLFYFCFEEITTFKNLPPSLAISLYLFRPEHFRIIRRILSWLVRNLILWAFVLSHGAGWLYGSLQL